MRWDQAAFAKLGCLKPRTERQPDGRCKESPIGQSISSNAVVKKAVANEALGSDATCPSSRSVVCSVNILTPATVEPCCIQRFPTRVVGMKSSITSRTGADDSPSTVTSTSSDKQSHQRLWLAQRRAVAETLSVVRGCPFGAAWGLRIYGLTTPICKAERA